MVVPEKLKSFLDNRWLVFVCAIWVQSFAGVGYVFGSISPVIKTNMGYNQRQICILAVAKDLGEFVGFLAGALVERVPIWSIMLIGALLNFLGYGFLWLVVTNRLPALPLWILCIAIFVGTNGETCYNTVALVSCVQNFPRNRGPVVGILKGFAGLTGAILTQIYAMFNAPDDSSLILLLAVGPPMVEIALMFIVRPISGAHKQVRSSDNTSFCIIYAFCLLLAAYLLAVVVVDDAYDVNQTLSTLIALILILLLVLPVIIPVVLVFFSISTYAAEESLLAKPHKQEEEEEEEVIMSEVEDEKPPELDSLPAPDRQKRIAELQLKLVQAAAQGAVRRKGPRRGEDFTLFQALKKADFLLLFFSFLLAAGSGLTIIDNMGQISQSLGFTNTNIYVSMISISNFLGRVGGGYFSEIIVRKFAYPRPVAMAVIQVIMAFAFLYYAMAWPGQIYMVTVLIGLGYGAQWAIAPASASELFGLKSFGALYNFLSMGCPAGSLIFSGVIASGIYDYYAEKQGGLQVQGRNDDDKTLTCVGSICYSPTCWIMAGFSMLAVLLSLIVVHRTKIVYAQLYKS